MPWFYVRDRLAQAWRCFPWEIDEAPAQEVDLKLRLMALEAKARR